MATPRQILTKINQLVEKSAEKFNGTVPALQQRVLDEITILLKDLDTTGDQIRSTVKNIRIIGSISRKLERIIFSEGYKKDTAEYLKAFNEISNLHHQYFALIEGKFKQTALLKEIRTQAIETTLDGLTESGLRANIIEPIKRVLQNNITGGGSYKDLTETLRTNLTNTDQGNGLMTRYLKTYTTTSVAQYSRTYSQTAGEGLNFEWFQYIGSNIETTRCFCLAMTEKKYFHKSEIPAILRGDFQEFDSHECELYRKTGLPEGMIKGTNESNFITLAGGWNCQHGIYPVPESWVPEEIKRRIKTIVRS